MAKKWVVMPEKKTSNEYDNGQYWDKPKEDTYGYNPKAWVKIQEKTDPNYYAHNDINEYTKQLNASGINTPAPDVADKGLKKKWYEQIFDPISSLQYGLAHGAKNISDDDPNTKFLEGVGKGLASGFDASSQRLNDRTSFKEVLDTLLASQNKTKNSVGTAATAGLNNIWESLPFDDLIYAIQHKDEKIPLAGKNQAYDPIDMDVVKKVNQGDANTLEFMKSRTAAPGLMLDVLADPENLLDGYLKAPLAVLKGSKTLDLAKGVNDVSKAQEALGAVKKASEVKDAQRLIKKTQKILGAMPDYEGFKIAGKTILSPETLAKVGDFTKLSKVTDLTNAIGNTKVGEQFTRMFRFGKNADWVIAAKKNPDEALKYIAQTESIFKLKNEMRMGQEAVIDTTKDIQKQFDANIQNDIRKSLEKDFDEITVNRIVTNTVINPKYTKAVNQSKSRIAWQIRQLAYNKSQLLKQLKNMPEADLGNEVEAIGKQATLKAKLVQLEQDMNMLNNIKSTQEITYSKHLESAGIDLSKFTNDKSLPLVIDPMEVAGRNIDDTIELILAEAEASGKVLTPEEARDIALRMKQGADNFIDNIKKVYPDLSFLYTKEVAVSDMEKGLAKTVSDDDTIRQLAKEANYDVSKYGFDTAKPEQKQGMIKKLQGIIEDNKIKEDKLKNPTKEVHKGIDEDKKYMDNLRLRTEQLKKDIEGARYRKEQYVMYNNRKFLIDHAREIVDNNTKSIDEYFNNSKGYKDVAKEVESGFEKWQKEKGIYVEPDKTLLNYADKTSKEVKIDTKQHIAIPDKEAAMDVLPKQEKTIEEVSTGSHEVKPKTEVEKKSTSNVDTTPLDESIKLLAQKAGKELDKDYFKNASWQEKVQMRDKLKLQIKHPNGLNESQVNLLSMLLNRDAKISTTKEEIQGLSFQKFQQLVNDIKSGKIKKDMFKGIPEMEGKRAKFADITQYEAQLKKMETDPKYSPPSLKPKASYEKDVNVSTEKAAQLKDLMREAKLRGVDPKDYDNEVIHKLQAGQNVTNQEVNEALKGLNGLAGGTKWRDLPVQKNDVAYMNKLADVLSHYDPLLADKAKDYIKNNPPKNKEEWARIINTIKKNLPEYKKAPKPASLNRTIKNTPLYKLLDDNELTPKIADAKEAIRRGYDVELYLVDKKTNKLMFNDGTGIRDKEHLDDIMSLFNDNPESQVQFKISQPNEPLEELDNPSLPSWDTINLIHFATKDGQIVALDELANPEKVHSLLKSYENLPEPLKNAAKHKDLKVLKASPGIWGANTEKGTIIFDNDYNTINQLDSTLKHELIHESDRLQSRNSTTLINKQRTQWSSTITNEIKGLNQNNLDELYELLNPDSKIFYNDLKKGYVDDRATYAIDASEPIRSKRITQVENLAYFGETLIGNDLVKSARVRELLPKATQAFYDFINKTPVNDIVNELASTMPAHSPVKAELTSKITKLKETIGTFDKIFNDVKTRNTIGTVLDRTKNRIQELETNMKNIDFLKNKYPDKFKDVPEFVNVSKEITEKIIKPIALGEEAGKVKDIIETHFKEWADEEGIEALNDYVTHVLNWDLKKDKKASKLYEDLFNPFDKYGQHRGLEGTIDKINKAMGEKYGAELGGKPFFETLISRIYLERGMYHEKFMFDKNYADTTLDLFGKRIDKAFYETMPKVDRKDYYETVNKLINDPNYVIVKPQTKYEPIKVKTLENDEISEGYTRRNAARETARLTNTDNPLVEQLLNAQASSPYIVIDPKKVNVQELLQQVDSPIHVMPRDAYEAYTKSIKDQFDKHNNAFLRMFDRVMGAWKSSAIMSPGFHMQNMIGNIFNSYLEIGANILNPELNHIAGKLQFDNPKGAFMGRQLSEWKTILKQYGMNDVTFFSEGMQDFRKGELESLIKEQQGKGRQAKDILNRIANPLSSKFLPHAANQKVGSIIENQARIVNFLSHVQSGKTLDEAAELTNKVLFDYQDLTGFEHDVMKRLIPFYTWIRKNLPLQIDEFMNDPTKYTRVNKGLKAIETPETEEEARYKPDYLKDMMHIGKGKYKNIKLPFQDLAKVTDPSDMFSSVNPLIKMGVELGANKNMFTGQPIADESGAGTKAIGLLKKIGYETPKGKMIDPKLKYMLQNIAPGANRINDAIQAFSPDATQAEKDKFNRTWNPAKLSEFAVDIEQQKQFSMYDYIDKLKKLVDKARKEGTLKKSSSN